MPTYKRSPFRTSRILFLALILGVAAYGANITGSITFKTATMPRQLPLGDALVTLYNSRGARTVTKSNDQGAYLFHGLAAGAYIVTVEKNGRRLYQGKLEAKEPDIRFDIRL